MATTDPIEQRARDLAQRALETLDSIMQDGDRDSARVAAANAVLDRGYGKPTQAIIAIPARNASSAALAALTDAELLALIGEIRNQRRGGDPGFTDRGGGLETACDPLSLPQPAPYQKLIANNSLSGPADTSEFHDPLCD